MALSKALTKLKSYLSLQDEGHASSIKPHHVEKIIEKLKIRNNELHDELAHAHKASKRVRLKTKIKTTQKQLHKAEKLLRKLD